LVGGPHDDYYTLLAAAAPVDLFPQLEADQILPLLASPAERVCLFIGRSKFRALFKTTNAASNEDI
jgi:hypothetical protein